MLTPEQMQEWRELKANAEADFQLIQEALRSISTWMPTGDDSVYDYWPNGLEMIATAYQILFTHEGPPVIEEYLIHHLDESVGSNLTQRIVDAIRDHSDTKVSVYEMEDPYPLLKNWPKERLVLTQ